MNSEEFELLGEPRMTMAQFELEERLYGLEENDEEGEVETSEAEYQFHTELDDGYLCKRTDEVARFIFWNGASPCPPGGDLCQHCSDWTPGSRLHKLNQERKDNA